MVNGPELLSEVQGESEAAVRSLFLAARALAPAVIFLDEVEAFAPARTSTHAADQASEAATRVLSTLLLEMEAGEQQNKCVPGGFIVRRAHMLLAAQYSLYCHWWCVQASGRCGGDKQARQHGCCAAEARAL